MQFFKISERCVFLAMDCRRGHLFGGVALNQSLDGLAEKVFRQRKAGRRRFNVGLCKGKCHENTTHPPKHNSVESETILGANQMS